MVVGEGMVAVVSALQDSGLTVSLLDANNQYTLLPPKAINKMYSMNSQPQQSSNQTQYQPYPDTNHVYVHPNNQLNNIQHPVYNNIHHLPARNMTAHNLPAHNLPAHNLPGHNLPAHNQYMPTLNIPAVMAQMLPQIQQNMAATFAPTTPGRRIMSDVGCGETSGVGMNRNYGIQAVDGRYTSTYKTSHCFVKPTSPSDVKSEFPPQRPNVSYGSDHFYVDGWGQRKNHQFDGRGQPRPDKEMPMNSTREQALFANSLRKYPSSSSPERSAEIIERLINYTHSKYTTRATSSRPSSPIRNSCEFDTIRPTNQRPIYRSGSPIRTPEGRAKWDTSYKDELPLKDVKKNFEKPYFSTTNEVRFLRDITRKVKDNMKHMAHGNHMKGRHEPSTSHDKYEVPQHDIIIACGTKRNTEAQATAQKCSQHTETMPPPPVEKKSVAISSVPEPKVSKIDRRLPDSETHITYKKPYTVLNLTPLNTMPNNTLELKKSKSLGNIKIDFNVRCENDIEFDKNKLKQDLIDNIYESNNKCGVVLSPGSFVSQGTYVVDECIEFLPIVDDETQEEIKINVEKLDNEHDSLLNCEMSPPNNNEEYVTIRINDSETDVRVKLKQVIEEWLKNLSLKLPDDLIKERKLQEIVDYFYSELLPIVENKSVENFEKILKAKIVEILEELPLDTFQKVTKHAYVRNMAVSLVKEILKLLGTTEFHTDQGSTSSSEYYIAENKCDEPIASHVKQILPDTILELNNNMKDIESAPSLSSVATEMKEEINNIASKMNQNMILDDQIEKSRPSYDFHDDYVENIETDGVMSTNENKVDGFMDISNMDGNLCQDFMDSQKHYMTKIVEQICEWLQNNNCHLKTNEFNGIIINIACDIVILKTYLEHNTTCFLTEREEINYLKIVVFKWLSKIIGFNYTKVIEEIRDLYDRIQNVDVPFLIGAEDENNYFVREQLVAPASNNNSYTLKNLNVNNSSLGEERPKSYLRSLEDAIMEWYHGLPLYVAESQRYDQNRQLMKKLATEINVKVKANPSNINEIIDKCVPSVCKKLLKSKNDKQHEEDLKSKLKLVPFKIDDNPEQVQARIDNLKAIIATWAQYFPIDVRKDSPYSFNRNREISDLAVRIQDVLDKYVTNRKTKEKKLTAEISGWLGGMPIANYVNKKIFKEYFTRTLINEIKASRIEEYKYGDHILGPIVRQWIWRLPAEDDSSKQCLIHTSEVFIETLSELFQSKACHKRFSDEITTYLNSFPLNTRFQDRDTITQNEIQNLLISICIMSNVLNLDTPFSKPTSFNQSKIKPDDKCMPVCTPFQTVMNTQQSPSASYSSAHSKTCGNKSCSASPNDFGELAGSRLDENTQTEQKSMKSTASGETQPAPKLVSRSTSLTDNRKLNENSNRNQTYPGALPAKGTQNTQTDYSNRNIEFDLNKKKPAGVGKSTSIGPGDREIMYDNKTKRSNTVLGTISSPVVRETPVEPPSRKSMPANLNPGSPEPKRRSEPARKPPSDYSSPTVDPMEKIFEDLLAFLRVWCAKIPIKFANPEDQHLEPQLRLGLQNGILREILKVRSTDRRCCENKYLFEDMLENEVDGLLDCLESSPELQAQRGPLKNELIQYVSRMNEMIMEMDVQQKEKPQFDTTVDYIELFDELKKTNFAGKFVDEHHPCDNRMDKIILTDYFERVMKGFLAYNKLENVKGTKDEIIKNMVGMMLEVPLPSQEHYKNKQQNLLLRNEIGEWFHNLPVDELPENERISDYVEQRLDNLANMMLGIENGFVNANESRTLEYELHVWLLTWSWPKSYGYHTNQWVSELLTRIRLNPDLKMNNCLPDWDLDPEQSLGQDVFDNRQPLSSTMNPQMNQHRRKSHAPNNELSSRGSPRRTIQSQPIGGFSEGGPSKKAGVPSRVNTSRGILGTSQVAGPSHISGFRPGAANPQEVAVTNEVQNWVACLPVPEAIHENRSKQLCNRIIDILNSYYDDTDVINAMNDQISSWLDESLPNSQKVKIPNYANQLTVAVLNQRRRPEPGTRQRTRPHPDQSYSRKHIQQSRSQNQRPRSNQDQNQRQGFNQDQKQRSRFDQDQKQRSRFDQDTGRGFLESSHSEPIHKKSSKGTRPMYDMSDDAEDFSCKCPDDEPKTGLRVCMRRPCSPFWFSNYDLPHRCMPYY